MESKKPAWPSHHGNPDLVSYSLKDQMNMGNALLLSGERIIPMQLSVDIEGMTCVSCVTRGEEALLKVDGVIDASVNLATESARITGNSGVYIDATNAVPRRTGPCCSDSHHGRHRHRHRRKTRHPDQGCRSTGAPQAPAT
jgi:copper chaperone CopZ